MKNRIPFPRSLVAALGFALLFTAHLRAAQETNTSPARVESAPAEETQAALRANLLLQEQVRTLQQAIEDYRRQTDAGARRNEDAMNARFGALEKSLDEQRKALDGQRQSELETSRTMMFVAGAFAVAGLAAILVTAWLQFRTVQRLTEVSSSLRLGVSGSFPLALNEGMTPGEGAVAVSRQRYLDEMHRLQRRVRELEHTGIGDDAHTGNGGVPMEPPAVGEPVSPPPPDAPVASSKASQVAALLGKGQTFLNLDQNEKALTCFDEALALDADHVDTLIKRGAALERLQRFDDAIAVYDRIIGLDERQTTAYLLKGGVFNRLKRFNDALACYDQALKTQSQRKG
jgi:tetratricopeptide (TPR) repeat protein